jgi:hypothetical protein
MASWLYASKFDSQKTMATIYNIRYALYPLLPHNTDAY